MNSPNPGVPGRAPLPTVRLRFARALPLLALIAGAALLAFWRWQSLQDGISMRVPGTDHPPGANVAALLNPVSAGKLVAGIGSPATPGGMWNQFRGPDRNGISPENSALARKWD